MSKSTDIYFTPSWAVTLVTGKVTEFNDTDLAVMNIFIRDEIAKRKAEKEVAA